jgi:hypothetical protein
MSIGHDEEFLRHFQSLVTEMNASTNAGEKVSADMRRYTRRYARLTLVNLVAFGVFALMLLLNIIVHS